MKILMMRPRLEKGGAAKFIGILAENLTLLGAQIAISSSGGEFLSEFQKYPYLPNSFYPSSLRNLLKTTLSISRYVKSQKIEIMHSHHRFSSMVGNFSKILTGIPLVTTVHEFKSNQRLLAGSWSGDANVAPSQALADHLSSYYGMKNVTVIRNAIRPPTPQNMQQPHDGLKVGFVGRLSYEKGADIFIDLAAHLLETHPQIEFVLVGDGPERGRLESLARRKNIEDKVIFKGFLDRIECEIAALDIVVIPSREENYSTVALESMACGKPVVSSGVGGLSEIILDQVTGLVIPSLEPKAFAQAVLQLMRQPEKMTEFGRNANKRFEQINNPVKMAKEYMAIYRELAQARIG